MNREQRRENGQNPMLDQLAQAAAAQQPQVQQLPFQPVPTNFQVLAVQNGGQDHVLLIVSTPTGQQGYFMPPDIAKQVAGGEHSETNLIACCITCHAIHAFPNDARARGLLMYPRAS